MKLSITEGVKRFENNEERFDDFINRDGYTDTQGRSVESVFDAVQTIKAFNPTGARVNGKLYKLKDLYTEGVSVYVTVVDQFNSVSVSADLVSGNVSIYRGVGPEELEIFGERNYKNYAAKQLVDAYSGLAMIIDTFGDSTMYSADTNNLSQQSPTPAPAHLQTILQNYYANGNIIVNNKAISGTTVGRMLAGTDGSGKTFDQRMAESAASIVYCNHCINSVQGDGNPESAVQFKKDIHSVVDIIRKYGKTPILVTPNPLTPARLGDRRKCEELKYYAEIIREVAAESSTMLADNHKWFLKLMASGKYSIPEIIPDGIHPGNKFYQFMGRNLAMPLLVSDMGFSKDSEYISAYSSQMLGTNSGLTNDINSKFGASMISDSGGVRWLRAVFVVEEPGLDIYSAHTLWPNGTTVGRIGVDDQIIANSFRLATPEGYVLTDHEIKIIDNCDVGLHLVEFVTTSAGLSLNYIRARKNESEKVFGFNGSNNYKTSIVDNYEHIAVSDNSIVLLDKYPVSHLIGPIALELIADLKPNTGIVFGGSKLTNYNTASPDLAAAVIVGLDADSKISIWEYSASGIAKIFTATNPVSAGEHNYYINYAPGYGGAISIYLDGVGVTNTSPSVNAIGGLLGFWKANTGSFMVKSLKRFVR